MSRIIILSIVLMTILINCHSNPEYESKSITLDNKYLPIQFIKDTEIKLDYIGTITFSNPPVPNQLILSIRESQNTDVFYLKFNYDLKLTGKMSIKKGLGPMECSMPVLMGGDETNYIVSDIPIMRYYLYDKEMKSRENLKAAQRGWIPHGLNYSAKYKTIVSCRTENFSQKDYGEDAIIYLRRLKDESLEDQEIFKCRWTYWFRNSNYFMHGTPFHYTISDDTLYILKKDEYYILKMDLTGKILKRINIIDLPEIVFSNEERRRWLNGGLQNNHQLDTRYPEKLWHANWIKPIGSGIGVGRIVDYNPENSPESGTVDYFDRNLNYLGKLKMPWFFGWQNPEAFLADFLIYSTQDYLFLIDRRETPDDEEYYLTRWRIIQ